MPLPGRPSQQSRWTSRAPREGRRSRSEVREHPLARAYEQGSCSALPVPAPSPDHVELLSRLLGRGVTLEEFQAWERVRLFVGYVGPRLEVEADRALQPVGPPIATPRTGSSGRVSVVVPATGVNPHDLGDD